MRAKSLENANKKVFLSTLEDEKIAELLPEIKDFTNLWVGGSVASLKY